MELIVLDYLRVIIWPTTLIVLVIMFRKDIGYKIPKLG